MSWSDGDVEMSCRGEGMVEWLRVRVRQTVRDGQATVNNRGRIARPGRGARAARADALSDSVKMKGEGGLLCREAANGAPRWGRCDLTAQRVRVRVRVKVKVKGTDLASITL